MNFTKKNNITMQTNVDGTKKKLPANVNFELQKIIKKTNVNFSFIIARKFTNVNFPALIEIPRKQNSNVNFFPL